MNEHNNYKMAFTIIEVILVLAIAGLIFLMIFVALPALQRSQRDTQRKNDMSRVMSAIQNYKTNNRGRYIRDYTYYNDLNILRDSYMIPDEEFLDPSTGEKYRFIRFWQLRPPEIGEIYYNSGAHCEGENLIDTSGNNAFSAIQIKLESGGYYCLDNK